MGNVRLFVHTPRVGSINISRSQKHFYQNCAEKWTPFNLVTCLNQRTYMQQICHATQIFPKSLFNKNNGLSNTREYYKNLLN
jgi:hypothetical protein